MNKTLKILTIIFLSLLIIALIGGFIALLSNKFDFSFSKGKLVYDEKITTTFNKIEIDVDSLDVNFYKSKDGEVNVKIYDKNEDDVTVKAENNTLYIKRDSNSFCWFFSCMNNKAEIYLPEKEYDLLVTSASGDITSEINFNNVDITTKSGDIELKNTKDVKINVTSGDIKIDEFNNAIIASTSGDLEIGKVNNSIEIQTTSGDIDINDLTITKDSSIKVTSGDILVKKASGDIYYETEVKSGDVRINNNNRHAKYELKIQTTSGDITVK